MFTHTHTQTVENITSLAEVTRLYKTPLSQVKLGILHIEISNSVFVFGLEDAFAQLLRIRIHLKFLDAIL